MKQREKGGRESRVTTCRKCNGVESNPYALQHMGLPSYPSELNQHLSFKCSFCISVLFGYFILMLFHDSYDKWRKKHFPVKLYVWHKKLNTSLITVSNEYGTKWKEKVSLTLSKSNKIHLPVSLTLTDYHMVSL